MEVCRWNASSNSVCLILTFLLMAYIHNFVGFSISAANSGKLEGRIVCDLLAWDRHFQSPQLVDSYKGAGTTNIYQSYIGKYHDVGKSPLGGQPGNHEEKSVPATRRVKENPRTRSAVVHVLKKNDRTRRGRGPWEDQARIRNCRNCRTWDKLGHSDEWDKAVG